MNFNTRSPVFYFTRFDSSFDWSILLPCYVFQGWMDKRINVETSVTLAALFPAVKNRSREEEIFTIKLAGFYGKILWYTCEIF